MHIKHSVRIIENNFYVGNIIDVLSEGPLIVLLLLYIVLLLFCRLIFHTD